jgi:hypothetical protein
MKKLLVLTIILVTGIASAQVKLTGVVKDSVGTPLEMANVIAINKLTKKMASYGFSDAKGRYKLNLKKNTTYNVKISYVGMKAADLNIEMKDKDIVKNVTLQYDNALDEINIVSKMPVTIKGDTIIYNADSFKNGSERKLEDVLKKIPGVEINDDGEIEIEGKKVEKVMVEGKDFFDGDSKLATKNIPSNAVDKIQVLKNYGDVNQLRGVQNNQDRIALNIKLKDGKKNFWFGDVTVGGGDAPDKSLYLVQPKLFYYSPKYSLNVIGDLNNLGEVAFTRRDYFNFTGGFRRPSQQSGTNISLGNNSLGFLTANNNNAREIETRFGALNFSYAPKKTLDLSGFAIFSSSETFLQQNSSQDYVDPTRPDEETQSLTKQKSDLGLFKFSSSYKPNINNQLDYDLLARVSKETQTQGVNSLVLSDIDQIDEATPYSINQNLNYYYTLNATNIFALEVQSLIQDEDPFYNAILENDPSSTTDVYDRTAGALGLDSNQLSYNISQNKRVKSNQLDAKLDYWNILNDKSNINLTFGTIYSKQNFDSDIFQRLDNGTIFNPTPDATSTGLTNPLNGNNTEYTFRDVYLGVKYQVKSGMFTFTPGVSFHSYRAENNQFSNETFTDKFERVLPSMNIRLQLKQSENLRFTYAMQTQFTDVNQIARGIVLNSYNSIFSGNPALESALSHNFNLSYFSFNMFNYTNVFAFLNYSKTTDQIRTDVNFQDQSVVSINSTLNSPFEDEVFTASGRWQKTFRKYRASLRATYNFSKFNQFLNGNVNTNKAFTQTYRTEFGTNFRKAPNVQLNYRLTIQDQNNTAQSNSTKAYTNAPSIEFDAYIWKKITFRTDYTYNVVSRDGTKVDSYDFWNATLSYRKDKDAKWEYEIKATNLLDTQSRINAAQNNVLFSINEVYIQPRFISLRLRYQL